MTHDLALLVWSTILGLATLGAASVAKRSQEPPGWQAGPRDTPPPAYSGVAGRLLRAQSNFMETFPFLAAAVLACHLAGRSGSLSGWGTALFFWSRLAYVPVYALGITYVRSLLWIVSLLGLCLVVAANFVGG